MHDIFKPVVELIAVGEGADPQDWSYSVAFGCDMKVLNLVFIQSNQMEVTQKWWIIYLGDCGVQGVSKVCAPQCPEFNSYLQDDPKSIRPVIDTQLTSMLDVTFATIVNIESNFCGQYHIFHLWYMPNMKGKFKQCKMFTMRTFGSVCALHAHGLLVRKIPKMSGYTRNVCEVC